MFVTYLHSYTVFTPALVMFFCAYVRTFTRSAKTCRCHGKWSFFGSSGFFGCEKPIWSEITNPFLDSDSKKNAPLVEELQCPLHSCGCIRKKNSHFLVIIISDGVVFVREVIRWTESELVARTRTQLDHHINIQEYWHQEKISRQGVGWCFAIICLDITSEAYMRFKQQNGRQRVLQSILKYWKDRWRLNR